MHWCPHPLWQHFSSLGQSLSSEQSSAHSPELQRRRGHTPGLAEETRESLSISVYTQDHIWHVKVGLFIESYWKTVCSQRWPKQRCRSCPLKKKFNTVARTESRRDTNSSTVIDTALVVRRTVFITHTALMWWDNIKETWAVAWVRRNPWDKEAVKQKRHINEGEWDRQTCTSFSQSCANSEDLKLGIQDVRVKTNLPFTLPSASAAQTKSKCRNAPSVNASAQSAEQCFSMLTCGTQERSPVRTNLFVHNLQAEESGRWVLAPVEFRARLCPSGALSLLMGCDSKAFSWS